MSNYEIRYETVCLDPNEILETLGSSTKLSDDEKESLEIYQTAMSSPERAFLLKCAQITKTRVEQVLEEELVLIPSGVTTPDQVKQELSVRRGAAAGVERRFNESIVELNIQFLREYKRVLQENEKLRAELKAQSTEDLEFLDEMPHLLTPLRILIQQTLEAGWAYKYQAETEKMLAEMTPSTALKTGISIPLVHAETLEEMVLYYNPEGVLEIDYDPDEKLDAAQCHQQGPARAKEVAQSMLDISAALGMPLGWKLISSGRKVGGGERPQPLAQPATDENRTPQAL